MLTKLQKYGRLIVFGYLLWGMWGCNAVRHLGSEDYLLHKDIKVSSEGKMKKSVLQAAIRTKPNRKIIVSRAFLHFYNFGKSLEKDSSWVKRAALKIPRVKKIFDKTVNWLQDGIGEPPVLLKLSDIRRDSINLYNSCFANGYLRPEISFRIDTIDNLWFHQRATINFDIKERRPYRIALVTYPVKDSAFREAYDIHASYLKVNKNYDHDLLTRERARANNSLRNAGYFTFSQKLIHFEVDTALSVLGQNLDYIPVEIKVIIDEIPPLFKVKHILISLRAPSDGLNLENVFMDTLRASQLSQETRTQLGLSQKKLHDSLNISFVVTATIIKKLNYNFIAKRIHLKEGAIYSLSAARLTQRHLQGLGMFQYAIINYEIVDSTAINVKIDMQMASHYQFKAGVEAFSNDITTSTNLPSIGANFTLRNKNTFGRSERFDWNVGGNVGFYSAEANEAVFDKIFYELGTSFNIHFPRLLIPIIGPRNHRLFSPTTIFNSSIRQESLREYERLTTGANLSYRWNHNPFSQGTYSQLTPLAIDFISVDIKDSTFQETVNGLPFSIQRDYEPRFSSRLSYSFTHSDYATTRIAGTSFLRLNFELGGNLPWLVDRLSNSSGQDTSYTDNLIFNRFFYAQYFKASIEGKYYYPLNDKSELVLRGIAGFSRAYGNTINVPQESRFFSGGTSSMRGWQSNTLGPGTLKLSDFIDSTSTNASLAAPGGEILMELNAELRFDIVSYLEMALFTDLGNVWFNKRSQALPDSQETEGIPEAGIFKPENLKLGWDAGFGFRFDFSFLILRLDIGQQLFAPDQGWVVRKAFRRDNASSTRFNLGIGYPF